MLSKAVIFIILVFQIYLYVFKKYPTYYDTTFLWLIVILNIVSLISFSLKKDRNLNLKNNKVKFSVLFLIGFLIVSFQPFLDLGMGFLQPNNHYLFIRSGVILKTLICASIALNSYLFGSILFTAKNIYFVKEQDVRNKINIKPLKIINFICFLFFISQINTSFLDANTYGSGREVSFFLGYSMLLYETSFLALILINIVNNGKKSSFKNYLKQYGYSFVLFVIYICIIIVSGDRGPIIYMSLALLFGYLYLNEVKISATKLTSVLIVGAVVISILGMIRRAGVTLDTAINSKIENTYYPDSFLPATKELATSVLTISTAVNKIPSNYDYFYGLFLFQNFSVIVPGLNSFLNSKIGIDANYFSSSVFLTYLSLGSNAKWGVGTSAIADVYLDFGIIGIILIFILFGYFTKKLEVYVLGYKHNNLLLVALYMLFFSFSIYIARSNLVVPLTKLTYVLVFYFMALASNGNILKKWIN
ncbi:oligosaccharide repeat unit polymerase [Chryseobacterium sp. SLBN-27]|uniref:O-antigen polymerase n=1 Tax=Chryseobacterium sp. SLBN-27 TaxID=3042287 RepID=UPI0028635176|nr:O-antigen polymerase [Chryseobacterium sp. SLBN-27]MDR6157745.1 oligosaccharide repeat unit polymerase [Chryseobacterium sp. SLBN-27]